LPGEERLSFRLAAGHEDVSLDAVPYSEVSIKEDGSMYVYLDGIIKDKTPRAWVWLNSPLVKRYRAGWDHHIAV
jgi:hypothetical protein